MFKLSDNQIEKIESLDFTVYEYGDYYSFQKYSSYGQDFNFDICKGETFSDFKNNLYDYYESFDVSYESSLWIDPVTGHGKNGAPYEIKDIVTDMEECENFILELYNMLNQ